MFPNTLLRRYFSMLMIAILLILTACESSTTVSNDLPTIKGEVDIVKLISQLIKSKDLEEAMEVTQTILALGGLSTIDGEETLFEGAAPAASATILLPELVNLARQARDPFTQANLSLADVAAMLQDLGWPFKEDAPPDEQLKLMLSEWVKEAMKAPRDPLHFTPLFLSRYAARKATKISLDSPESYNAQDYRLTFLELQLLAAAFDRVTPVPSKESGSHWLWGIAHASEPCSDIKKWFGDLGGDAWKAALEAGQIALGEQFGDALKNAVGNAAKMSEQGTEAFGKAMSSLSIASKLWKLANLYNNVELKVLTGDNGIPHKPGPDEKRVLTEFKAVAGVSEQDWKKYEESWASSESMRAMRDCFNFVNLPTLADLGDLGKDASSWEVEWDLVGDSGDHGFISLDANTFSFTGQQQMKLKKETDYSAVAYLYVDLAPEKAKDHRGEEKMATITAKASLDTSSMPSLGAFVNSGKAGYIIASGGTGAFVALGEALVEITTGWLQIMVQPEAYGFVHVTYHTPKLEDAWYGTITYSEIYQHAEQKTYTDQTFESSTTDITKATITIIESERTRDNTMLFGDANIERTLSETVYTTHRDGYCSLVLGSDIINTSKDTSDGYVNATENVRANFNYALGGGYQIDLHLPSIQGASAKHTTVGKYTMCGGGKRTDKDINRSVESQFFTGSKDIKITGKMVDENSVTGQLETVESDGTKIIIKWDLKRR